MDDAVNHANKRNSRGIRVVLDPLSTYAKCPEEVDRSVQEVIRCLNVIRANGLYASVAIKLSALGMSFDRQLCRDSLLMLADEGLKRAVQLEIDMEGKSSVDFTMDCAIKVADEGYRTTLAVQAYLDRTPQDVKKLVKEGVMVRLVKGAYQGDTDDFSEVQRRMISMADDFLNKGKRFNISTHDPVIIDHVRSKAVSRKQVEFGMLMGLGDKTKIDLSTGEWDIVEYVPYGADSEAYVHRREVYLNRLKEIGKSPAP